MATIRINGADPIGRTLRLVSQGTIAIADWESLITGWQPQGGYHRPLETMSLRHYGRLLAIGNDYLMVLWHINATGIKEYAVVDEVPAALFLDTLVGLKADIERIGKAFGSLPKASLTPDEVAAGFDKLDFGLFGIVDTLACRQGITDEQVRDMPLADVLGKLNIIAQRSACERRLTEIRRRKH